MPPHTASTHAAGGLLAVPGLQAADTWALMQAAQTGAGASTLAMPSLLYGRHVALVTSREHDPSAEVFARAAQAMGAHVASILPADLGLKDAASASHTARLLGRLYDVVGCAGLDLKSVALLKRTCGVPVLHDLAADTHASRLLADVMTLKQALHAAASPSPASPRLGVYGPARSALLRIWKKVAADAGVDVVSLSEPGADAPAAGCHFVCRPGVPPELLAVAAASSRTTPREASLADLQRRNHRLVVQALLRSELGRLR